MVLMFLLSSSNIDLVIQCEEAVISIDLKFRVEVYRF